jgi:hypothetical protein
MQPLSQSLKQVIESWQKGTLELLPPATPERIHAVLQDIGQKASADVIELYTTTGGFDDMDGHFFCLWSLDRILKENAATDRPGWAFADELIESHLYRLLYKNELESSVWIYDGRELVCQVASSLAEFFHLYLNDPDKVALLR